MDLAFTWAGFVIRWQVEIEDYPRQILQRHWPDVPRYRDVRGVTGRGGKSWRRYERLAPVDVMVGGFPCQDISVAGRGAGIQAGTRSGLWFEFARLIGELRPRVVLLENVSAILARDGTVVIGSLAEMGYDCRWGTIRATDAGAPHQRERWFCVAVSESERAPAAQQSGQWRGAEQGRPVMAGANHYWQSQPQGGIGEQRRRAGDGGESLANASGPRLAQRESQRRDDGAQQPPAERGGDELAHTQGRAVFDIRRERRDVQGEERRQWQGDTTTPGGRQSGGKFAVEPRLGRGTHGLPGGLDFPGWPAGPGQQQHEWEPPRVVSGQPRRAARLRALGNAVVPQVVYPLAVAIREWLEAQDASAAGKCENEAMTRTFAR